MNVSPAAVFAAVVAVVGVTVVAVEAAVVFVVSDVAAAVAADAVGAAETVVAAAVGAAELAVGAVETAAAVVVDAVDVAAHYSFPSDAVSAKLQGVLSDCFVLLSFCEHAVLVIKSSVEYCGSEGQVV